MVSRDQRRGRRHPASHRHRSRACPESLLLEVPTGLRHFEGPKTTSEPTGAAPTKKARVGRQRPARAPYQVGNTSGMSTPWAYYNEIDPKAAAWLRELIKVGAIAPGEVDERSILDVKAEDLKGFTQCHLFAGIGIWSAALRLAGWPDDRPVWSGSCPCQSFSTAGKGLGIHDSRHLWPHMFRLIRECRPDAVFAEQVEAAIRHGWIDGVCNDLEAESYRVGSCVLAACSVGAPHIRQRLYWVASRVGDTNRTGCGEQCRTESIRAQQPAAQLRGDSGRVGEPNRSGWDAGEPDSTTAGHWDAAQSAGGRVDGVADSDSTRTGCQPEAPQEGQQSESGGSGKFNRLADAKSQREQREQRDSAGTRGEGDKSKQELGFDCADDGGLDDSQQLRRRESGHPDCKYVGDQPLPTNELGAPWNQFRIIACRDGKSRRIPGQLEPSLQPLADDGSTLRADVDAGWRQVDGTIWPLAQNVKGRAALLKGAGNAIVMHLAAQFIRAYMEATGHAKCNR